MTDSQHYHLIETAPLGVYHASGCYGTDASAADEALEQRAGELEAQGFEQDAKFSGSIRFRHITGKIRTLSIVRAEPHAMDIRTIGVMDADRE